MVLLTGFSDGLVFSSEGGFSIPGTHSLLRRPDLCDKCASTAGGIHGLSGFLWRSPDTLPQPSPKIRLSMDTRLGCRVSMRAGKQVITPLAWRVAAKQWLQKNGLIRIEKAGKVSPNSFPEIMTIYNQIILNVRDNFKNLR
jgi:hypothetical protein